ncbi:hypothetical protein [Nocardia altamirensis]|uniref:hypothetical protein n=1 Tax=Nocardia altamirensis TaxID=472158 RepID=UPI00084092EF|nr:hypothetical protein [Nocardia altamirensis]
MGNLRKTVPAALVLAAAGLVMNAPQSAAAELGLGIVHAGGGFANGTGTGCGYLAIANTKIGDHVDFYDNGVWFAGVDRLPERSFAATWIPATPGSHTLSATNGSETATLTVQVGTGINLGSSCLVI